MRELGGILVACALVACGGTASSDAGATDAGGDAGEPPVDAGSPAIDAGPGEDAGPGFALECALGMGPRSAVDPLTQTGTLFDIATDMPIPGATIDVFAMADDAMIGTGASGAGGSYSVMWATGGEPIATYKRIRATGYLDFYEVPPDGLSADVSNISLYSITAAALEAYAASVGITMDPARGTLIVQAGDCATFLRGGTVTVPGVDRVYYTRTDATLDASLTAFGDSPFAVAFNVPPGDVDAQVRAGAFDFPSWPAPVVAGAVTQVVRNPTDY